MTDEEYMSMALRLAENARGRTSPNPLVGAVVVKDDRVVAAGWHRKAGTPHAEIHALNMAGELAHGATMYVTLEPCDHYGRTGPCSKAIIEAGISRPGEMARLEHIVKPTIGVMTNLGAAHQENFMSYEIKCSEKMKLFRHCKTVIVNSKDPIVQSCADTLPEEVKREALQVRQVEKEGDHATVHFEHQGQVGQYTIPFIDDASIDDSIICAATVLHLGLTPADLAERMPHLDPVAMRLEVKEGQCGCTLINDSYNSDVNSLDIALDFMSRRPDEQGRSRTLILSDIYQSGEPAGELYRQVNDLCMKRGIDKLIGIGDEISAQSQTFLVGKKYFFATTQDFLASTAFHQLRDEVILIKGARNFGFERISELLEQKVHETRVPSRWRRPCRTTVSTISLLPWPTRVSPCAVPASPPTL